MIKDNRGGKRNVGSKINNILDNGQVITFSIGPTMTVMTLYNGGIYSYNQRNIDAPMKFAEDDIVPAIENEAVVVVTDFRNQVSLRSNWFKKRGFEVSQPYKGKYETEKYLLIRRKK